jgi:hypothetical protein
VVTVVHAGGDSSHPCQEPWDHRGGLGRLPGAGEEGWARGMLSGLAWELGCRWSWRVGPEVSVGGG